ncbi:hypothetical protein P872_09380 [Rhodonellum psychrophilum GCM71 = DSM 17998]|uniref:Uncharacterized protein n=2 Tax=Rhodonellum TaxID=336827 RepID=U5BXS6_9BACT|nr:MULTISPECIES: hypothetical protein [Rhodonellum]ERM81421.1 hypothetical protein P872_09380 [Rhodonellum psychrophilum GCM71 = DSM 17998]SDZ56267.1 hypothetical protein SAMN05444412_1259 [Rhodonellum ikkaensis]
MISSLLKHISFFILLIQAFPLFAQEIQEEKVYVHLNKTIAITGESIWFDLRVATSSGECHSRIVYGELVNREGKGVQQSIFTLENGKAEGSLEIPGNLVSDHYILRFYTRISPMMGNEGIDNQFITVINPKNPPKTGTNKTSGLLHYSPKKASLQENLISESNAKKRSMLTPDLGGMEGENMTISVSIKNPFLLDDFKGRFNREIYQAQQGDKKWIPEPFGHVVFGKNLVAEIDTTETFFLSSHGSQSVLNTAKPKPNGDLFFDLGALKQYDYFIIQSSKWEQQLNFSIQSPFCTLKFKEDFVFPELILEEKDRPFLLDLIAAGKVSPYFYQPKSTDFQSIVTGFVADKTYLLDDYTRFDKLETVLREYVPEVAVRSQSKKTVFKLLNSPISSVFEQNPLMLIDAMPVFDSDVMATFNPEKIQKLEVLSREFFLNADRFAGVLSFTSYENDFGGYELPATALYLNYPLIQPKKALQSPHFNAKRDQSNFPDFRNALFWKSEIISTADFDQIFTSEIQGEFEITISFYDEKGDFKMFRDGFEVRN